MIHERHKEMVSMLLPFVFDTKIIDYNREGDETGDVLP